ncbi:cell division protein FtsI (penicillin-binding protein 3) [Hypnocyclicus thermotrophus]|uniref:Cell division protein FtsI (Penicillin-binding protein 3) n=1 Tax=Hypnocyclicus thermotrophus TaxID=1627895 RepID=A0AA46DXS7_9FUSO|nr:penicillin-binding protein [Hypnocyclicus thermotrophus]TDT68614.1 cell division protein FtsI (penicillin-binding protein 3) [Hypnocyclicus thermotrophus]
MEFNNKLKFFLIFIIFVFVILLGRLFSLQIIQSRKYKEIVKTQIIKNYNLEGKRGKILSKNGDELAYDITYFYIILNPYNIVKDNVEKEYSLILSKYIKEKKSSFEKLLNKKYKDGRKYLKIKNVLDEKLKEKLIKELKKNKLYKYSYITFETSNIRKYANEKLFRHIIGFLGYNEDNIKVGKFGVEKIFENELKGKKEKIISYVEKTRKRELPMFSSFKNNNNEINPDGDNVVLTIDYFMQYILYEELISMYNDYQPNWASGIIMNPNNGEILSMVSLPVNKVAYTKNTIIQNIYEPGSVMKPIIVSAALEEKLVSTKDTFNNLEGKIVKYDAVIRDSSNSSRGILKLEDVLIKSSNVGMVKIADRIDAKTFEEYLKKFGFYEKTNIDLPNEINIKQLPYKKWDGLKKYTMAFGQGIAVTPIQMINAFSAVINGGILYKPRVIKKITTAEGETIKEFKSEIIRSNIISKETSDTIKKILYKVVEEGTGKKAKIDGYSIGGKTGTSQKSENGRYSDDKFIVSFMGFYPLDKPEYLILLIADDPKSDKNVYGGSILAPVFKNVMKRIFKYKNIPPEKNIEELEDEEVKYNKIEFDLKYMPELKGLTYRDVIGVFKDTEFKLDISGRGKVVYQYPKPGIELKKNIAIKIKLEE